ncbi:MAG TPA: hypothetical protein VJ617_19955 [Arthrobacter sp.]|nr:hypothetical protein [Arthrobacter sp.]
MSVRHRVVLAMSKHEPGASYAYEVFYGIPGHATFVFEQARSAEIVVAMLRIIIKRKPLIHKGRKPR